jgi:putative membrane protein
MSMRSLLAAGALLCALAPAHAQQAVSGQDFVATVASSDMFEIKSSQMALKASASADVKSFAQQMINDHTKASKKLKTAAAGEKIKVPVKADDKHQAMLAALEGKKGADFDRAYMEEQTKAHDEAVALFSSYAETGDEPKLKAFAADTLPKLKTHQEHAKKLNSTVM